MILHRLSWVVIISIALMAACVAVTDVGRPAFSGQPALVSDQAASRLDPAGFDQAQRAGR